MKIKSRWVNYLIAWTASILARLLFLTVRVDHRRIAEFGTPYVRPEGTVRYVFCMWHDGIAIAVFAMKTWFLSGLISQHRDGGYLADAAKLSGIVPVRGSTTRGGAEAVSQLLSMPGYHLAMTPDGPQGPRRRLKEGIIFIASRSGRPIVPTAITADRFWSIRGRWTDLLVPKLFARVVLIAGNPIEIPPNLSREEITEYTRLLQQEMERLNGLAERIVRGDESDCIEIGQRVRFPSDPPGDGSESALLSAGPPIIRGRSAA